MIEVERQGAVAWVVLNEPERRNPLTVEFIPDMLRILDELEADPGCRVIVLTGEGKVFCAGADLQSVVSPEGVDMEHQFRLVRGFNRVVRRMRELEVPIVGAINGAAVGGGAALAMACDFAIASERASLLFAFGRIGAASADMGCTYLLPRIVGEARARHLLLTGARLDARRCLDLGLFVEVVPADTLRAAAERAAEQILVATPRRAAAATKLALGLGHGADLATSLGYEAYMQSYMFLTEDHRSRLAKFLEGKG